MKPYRLAETLTRLMERAGLSTNDLSRETGLSVAAITKLKANPESNPTIHTLGILANCLKVTLDQLLGLESIDGESVPVQSSPLLIPVLQLEEVANFKKIKKGLKPGEKSRQWISVRIDMPSSAFALFAKGTQTAQFPEGSCLIFDTNDKMKDSNYVIVLPEHNKIPVIRQYINTGTKEYFKNLTSEIKEVEHYQNYRVLAVLQQTQVDYKEPLIFPFSNFQ